MKLFASVADFCQNSHKIVINKLYVYNKKSYRKVSISGISLLKMINIYICMSLKAKELRLG